MSPACNVSCSSFVSKRLRNFFPQGGEFHALCLKDIGCRVPLNDNGIRFVHNYIDCE